MSDYGKIILEIEGKDTSGTSVLTNLRKELESLVTTYKSALAKIGAEFDNTNKGRSAGAKKLTEEERKELEAQIRLAKLYNEQIKADYKLMTEAKLNIDKEYSNKYLQNARANVIAEKQLIQEAANDKKFIEVQKLNEIIALEKGMSAKQIQVLNEESKAKRTNIQEEANLRMKAIDSKFKEEVAYLNKLVSENKKAQQEILKDREAIAKKVNDVVREGNKQTLAEVKDLVAKINAEVTKGFTDEFKKAQNKQREEIAKTLQAQKDAAKEAAKAQKEAYNAPIKEKTAQISTLGINLGDLRSGISQLEQLKQTVKSNDQASKDYKNTLQLNINKYKEQAVAIEDQIRSLMREREALRGNKGALDSNNQSIKQNVEELKLQRQLISGVTDEARRQTDTYGNMGGVIWQTRAALHAFLDTINLLINSPFVEWGKQVDVNFQNMNSIMFLLPDQLKALKQEVYDLINSEGAVGIEDVSKSLFALSSAGYEGADAMKILKESVKTASASLETTEDTLKSTIATLKTYGYTADQARRVQNTFMVGVQDGIFTMKELNQYVGQAISLASEFRDSNGKSAVSIEQVTSALVATTLQGVNMSNSVTAVNQVFKTFLDPSEQAAKRAKELGIDLSAAAFETKNFGEVIVDLLDKTTGKDQQDFLGEMFGNIRALKGVFKLAKDDASQFIKTYEKLEKERQNIDQDGKIARDRSQKEQEESFQSHVNRIKNKFGVFMTQTSELAFAGLKPLAKMLESIITWFNNLSEPTRKFVQGLILTAFTVGALIASLVTLIITIAILSRSWTLALPVMKAIGAYLISLTVGVTGLSTSFTGLAMTLTFVSMTAGGIILVLGTLAAAIYTVQQAMEAVEATREEAERHKALIDQRSEMVKTVKDLLELEKERTLTQAEQLKLARAMGVLSVTELGAKQAGFGSRAEIREEAQRRGALVKQEVDQEKEKSEKIKSITQDRLNYITGVEEKYSKDKKKHSDDIQKDILSQYENEKREINESFTERLAFYKDRLTVDAELRDQSKKLSQEEKNEILNNISLLELAKRRALEKAAKEESDRRKAKQKQESEDREKALKDQRSALRDKMNSEINTLDKLINQEKAKTKSSMAEKLAVIENYLRQQAVIYDKYSKNTIFLPGERSQLAEKSSAKTTQIATERKRLEEKSINDAIEQSKMANDIRIKQIENRGILENQKEEDILEEKRKAYNDYAYILKSILDKELLYTELTEKKKLEIQSELADTMKKKSEADKQKRDSERAKELNQRDFNFNEERETIELHYKLEMLSFEEYQAKKEALRKVDLINVRKDIDYEKKANGGRQAELNSLYEKERKLLNDGDLSAQESLNFRIASDKALYESKLQYFKNLQQLGLINSFEERKLTREQMEYQLTVLEEQLRREKSILDKDPVRKAKIEREKEAIQIGIRTSLIQDSQEIVSNVQNVLTSTNTMLDQIERVATGSAKLFIGVSKEVIDLTSKVTSNIGKIASGDVAGGVIGLLSTGVESVTKLFTSINDQVTNYQKSLRDKQRALLESEKDTYARKIKTIREQAEDELKELEKLSERTIYDKMIKANQEEAIERRKNTAILEMQREFYEKQRDLEKEFFEAKQASKTESQIREETLSQRTGTLKTGLDFNIIEAGRSYGLDDNQIARIRKGKSALTEEEKLFQQKLFVIGQNFLNEKAQLEEEFRTRRIASQKYEGKINRIFNEEQNASELEKLKEKYENEVEYINNTFAEHEGKAKKLADLKAEYEKAITTVTIEENKKRAKAISDGQEEILKAYKDQKKLLDDMYKEESNRIDKSLDDIRKKYTAESDRIREINKILGQDKVDEQLNRTVNTIYTIQRDKLIEQTPGSFYRQTDEEFTESIKRRENALKDSILGGLSFDDRLKEEQAIALAKVAYLTEYKSKFRTTAREYTQAEVDIRVEKERFFELEKEKIKKDAERIALLNEKAQKEATMKDLAIRYEKEIQNARVLESTYNQSILNLQSALDKARTSFSNGMINIVSDFGVGMFKVANDFANQLALKLSEKMPSLNISGGSSATKSTTTVATSSFKPAGPETYDQYITRIKQEDTNAARKSLGLPPLQFADGGISEGSKSGYAITAHGRELHLNESQSDNLAYLFKLANMGVATSVANSGINTSNSNTNISVTNNFSGMKISSNMDLEKVTAQIEKSIDKKLKRIM